MNKIVSFLFVLVLVFGFSVQTYAELYNRGTDNLGNQLIYDSDLNITWYDFTKSGDYWQNQIDWADGLDVSFGGTNYTDWRLPTTVDGTWVFGYDGTTTAGYNITSSEMGHLYYVELGNKGAMDIYGNVYPAGWGLTNTGPFKDLQAATYWSGTEYAADPSYAWAINFTGGNQSSTLDPKNAFTSYALAVRPGDVTVVPEPISLILFLTGGAILIGRKYIRKKV
jgi:hypothetical protein